MLEVMEILVAILSYLTAADLRNCYRVSLFWKNVVKNIIRHRLANTKCGIATQSYDCAAKDRSFVSSVAEATAHFMTPLRYAIIFADASYKKFEPECLLPEMPPTCEAVIVIYCYRTIYHPDVACGHGGEKRLVTLLLAKSESLSLQSINKDDSKETVETKLGGRDLKAVVVLSGSKQNLKDYHMHASTNNREVVIAGAYATSSVAYLRNGSEFKANACNALAFYGRYVQVACAVLPQVNGSHTDLGECIPQVESNLNRLQRTGISEKASFALFFPCAARYTLPSMSAIVQAQCKYELLPFQKRFPSTPCLGFFGEMCEIGHDYFPDFNNTMQSTAKKLKLSTDCPKDFRDLCFGFTTVILMLSTH